MKTICQQLNIREFPFTIKDSRGNRIYYESSTGYWSKREYDSSGNTTYLEDSEGYWSRWEYDFSSEGSIYHEDSDGGWSKWEYDSKGNEIYYEDSDGEIIDNRPKPVVELTMEELTQRLGYEVKIKK